MSVLFVEYPKCTTCRKAKKFLTENNITDINDIPKLDYSEIIDYLNNKGHDVNSYCEVEKYFINKDDFYNKDKNNVSTTAISLSDFNKIGRAHV